jgi:hypothetical protein
MEALLKQRRLQLHTEPEYSREDGGCEDRNGEVVETQVADILNMDHDDSHLWDLKKKQDGLRQPTHYDEVKACRRRYANGQRGRWAIFEERHQERLEASEQITYLVFVHDGCEAIYRRVTPEAMDALIKRKAGLKWHNTNMEAGRKVKVTWNHLIEWEDGDHRG